MEADGPGGIGTSSSGRSEDCKLLRGAQGHCRAVADSSGSVKTACPLILVLILSQGAEVGG